MCTTAIDLFTEEFMDFLSTDSLKKSAVVSKDIRIQARHEMTLATFNALNECPDFELKLPPIDKFQHVSWNDKFMGFTGYLDRFTKDDIDPSKIGIGIDKFDRYFICMYDPLCDDVITVFQRYSDTMIIWAWGTDGHFGPRNIYGNSHMEGNWEHVQSIIDNNFL